MENWHYRVGIFTPRSKPKIEINPSWYIRISKDAFTIWCQKKNKHIFFFEGDAKENIRVIHVGRIIFYRRGTNEINYAWGLKVATNNQA